MHDHRYPGGLVISDAHAAIRARPLPERTAMVRDENNEGILQKPLAPERSDDPTDVGVQTGYHRVIVLVIDVHTLVQRAVLRRRLERRVRRVVGLVEKKRSIGVLLDKPDTLIGLYVLAVCRFVGRADPMGHQRVERFPVVEEPGIAGTEMPLADVRVLITRVVEVDEEVIPKPITIVVPGVRQAFRVFRRDFAGKARGINDPLQTVLVGIDTGKNRSARRRAQACRRIGIVETDSRLRQGIDVGRLYGLFVVNPYRIPA